MHKKIPFGYIVVNIEKIIKYSFRLIVTVYRYKKNVYSKNVIDHRTLRMNSKTAYERSYHVVPSSIFHSRVFSYLLPRALEEKQKPIRMIIIMSRRNQKVSKYL